MRKVLGNQNVRVVENVLATNIDTRRELQRLLEKWHGRQRAVAEAVVAGHFTVRGLPTPLG